MKQQRASEGSLTGKTLEDLACLRMNSLKRLRTNTARDPRQEAGFISAVLAEEAYRHMNRAVTIEEAEGAIAAALLDVDGSDTHTLIWRCLSILDEIHANRF